MIVPVSKAGIVVAMAVVLSGCCSNVSTDPRQGGLAGGVCGTTTGAYDQRIAALETRAKSLDAANASLQARLAVSNREADALARDIAAKRRQLATIQADLRTLERLAGEKAALRAQISALMAEASAREGRIMAIENGMHSASNERIREDAKRQAAGVPVDDLLQRIRDLRAEVQ